MNREIEPNHLEQMELANGMLDAFIQRRDMYPKQLDDGSYVCIKKPLTLEHIAAHLQGKLTIGAYVLNPDSLARYVVFDGDDDAQLQSLIQLQNGLNVEGLPTYLEASRRGGHLWIFFEQPVSGILARQFGAGLIDRYHLPKMEFFPKQDRLQSGPGSLVRLPFGIHRRTGLRYGFMNAQGEPLAESIRDQVYLLTHPKRIPFEVITQFQTKPVNRKEPEYIIRVDPGGAKTPSVRIKASISAFDFIGNYVELTPEGRGLCPFHSDRVASFAVDKENNYWHCFAGCGGGSIIDFWMKHRNCDFITAVRELLVIILNQ